jgi:hypothetical protein
VSETENRLLITRLRDLVARIAAGLDPAAADAAWAEAETAVNAAGAGEEAAIALPVLERDANAVAALVAAWDAKTTPLATEDQAVLRRAMNAYKKRLKLTRADDEYSSSRNPLSRGTSSSILGVRPPDQFTADVWALLVRHGRLRDGGHGLLEPIGEGPGA